MWRVARSCFSTSSTTTQPGYASGRPMSNVIAAGWCSFANANAVRPLGVTTESNPASAARSASIVARSCRLRRSTEQICRPAAIDLGDVHRVVPRSGVCAGGNRQHRCRGLARLLHFGGPSEGDRRRPASRNRPPLPRPRSTYGEIAGERRSLSQCTFQRYFTAEMARELPADGKSETRAAVFLDPRSACWNDSKIRLWSFSSMPMPVSITRSRGTHRRRPVMSPAPDNSTLTEPWSVNLSALATRFFTICFTRV